MAKIDRKENEILSLIYRQEFREIIHDLCLSHWEFYTKRWGSENNDKGEESHL